MRIVELEVSNVRGIKDLSLNLEGNNFVVWGPNGSGKSAVIDAVDFLLTGRITRLTGQGTGPIKLNKHGPHIDHHPKEAIVRARVELPRSDEPIWIERCFSNPYKLICDPSYHDILESICINAGRGQHILTRREILRYVTVEAGARAEEIQALLDLQDIENTRKSLVKISRSSEREHKTAVTNLQKAKGAVASEVQLNEYNSEKVLALINQCRSILGAEITVEIHSSLLKLGVKPPRVITDEEDVNVTLFENNIRHLQRVLEDEYLQFLEENDRDLRSVLLQVTAKPENLVALERLNLIKLGMRLMDESGDCPLCDTIWAPGKLKVYLESKVAEADIASEQQRIINQKSLHIIEVASAAVSSLTKVTAVTNSISDLSNSNNILRLWNEHLDALVDALGSPLEQYLALPFTSLQIRHALAPHGVEDALVQSLEIVRDKYPEATPEQTAWDTLTRLEVSLRDLESNQAKHDQKMVFYQRAYALLISFLAARDSVLNKLYSEICDRFSYLYQILHGPDEEEFQATLAAEEAALNFEVDFYGRGSHPPNALHSEGHQDSMGLCLFLALSERLSEGLIDLIIFDDVVMSVDANHRRQICKLLASEFSTRQFLITTHDKTWANQLRTEGVVHPRSSVEFFSWSIDTGPQVNYEPGMWASIETDLANNDVPSAAAKLRRGSEEFFTLACDALAAPVTFKMDGRWELGDLLPSAYSRYGKILRKAKASAQSWGREEVFDRYVEMEGIAKQIYAQTRVEQWGINASVHYNGWTNLTPTEFKPIVDAYHDLHLLFICSQCGGMLGMTWVGKEQVSVSCNCGEANWHLKKRKKSK